MVSNIEIDVPKIYLPHYNDERPYQIWKGSRYSAKSWTKALFFLLHCRSDKYFRLVYARDTQKNVRKSQYQLFIDISKKFGLFKEFDFRGTDMQITNKRNGNFMIGGSFEQPDTLRSTADVTDFWAEEPITRTFSIDRESFFDIVGSLRNSYGVPPKFHFTFNPIGMDNFIYKDFFSDEKLYDESEVNILTANYPDNPYCPQSAKDFLEKLRVTHPSRYEVDGLGLWGVPENANPFFYAFDENKHVSNIELQYNKAYPVYLAFDFNIDPMTCVVAQLLPGTFCNIIKAYKIHNCTLKDLIMRIKSDFPQAVFRVTADPAGGARSAGYESVNTTMHSIIRRELGIGINQMDKPLLNYNRHDAWTELRIFANTILQNHPNFFICKKNCLDLIHDLKRATTEDGKDKLFKTSGNTEHGNHLTDGFMYLLTTYFNNYMKRKL
jgi:phage terminase large subunit